MAKHKCQYQPSNYCHQLNAHSGQLSKVLGSLFFILLAVSTLFSLLLLNDMSVTANPDPDLALTSIRHPAPQLMRASLLITFTPVATAYLPAVLNEQTPVPAPTLTPEPLIPDVQLSHIEYNPPGLDSEGEYVDIRSFETDSVDMTGWTLRDEVNTVFTFPAFTLAGQASVRIWIRSGSNDAGNLYWGRNSATWNNDGDTATLRNSSGQQVDQCSYSGGGEDVDC